MVSYPVYRGYYQHRTNSGARRGGNFFSQVRVKFAEVVGQVHVCFKCFTLTLLFLFLVAAISFAVPPLKQKYFSTHEITELKTEADRISRAVNGNLKGYDSLDEDVSRLSQETLKLINQKNTAAAQDRKYVVKNANLERELQSIDFNVDGSAMTGRAVGDDGSIMEQWTPERERISLPMGSGCGTGKNSGASCRVVKGKLDDYEVCSIRKLAPRSKRHSLSSSPDLPCALRTGSNHYGGRGPSPAVGKRSGTAAKSVKYKYTWGDDPVVKKHNCLKYDKE